MVDPDVQETAIYGTDLGITYNYQSGGTQDILFGDSWTRYTDVWGREMPSLCLALPAGPANEDAYATLPWTRPASLPTTRVPAAGTQAPHPTFVTDPANGGAFKPILVYDSLATLNAGGSPLPSGWGRTPVSAFQGPGSRPFAVFMLNEFASGTTGCTGGTNGFTTRVSNNTTMCVDPNSSQSTDNRDRVMDIRIAYRPTPSNKTQYATANVFKTNKFINSTIAIGTGSDSDTLYMWGRPYWQSIDSTSRARLYLLKHSLSALTVSGSGTITWNPQYLKGVTNGVPQWSGSQSEAKCIYGAGCITSGTGTDEFTGPGQMDILRVPGLNKWVMLYGGDLSDFVDTFLRTNFAPNMIAPNDEPAHGAIHVRMADNPWGPWTRPAPTLFRKQAEEHLACHAAGSNYNANTTSAWPEPSMPSFSCPGGDEAGPDGIGECALETLNQNAPSPQSIGRGNLYAPNVIESWTSSAPADAGPYTRAAQIFWNVSTWNPYEVIVVSTRLELPPEYVTYNRSARVRSMRDQNFISRNAPTGNPRAFNKSTNNIYSKFRFEAVSGSGTVKNGDVVQVARIGSSEYLGSSLGKAGYFTWTGVKNTQWVIRVITGVAGEYGPNGELIAGKTRFRLELMDPGRYGGSLRNSGNTADLNVITAAANPSVDHIWQASWECKSGDECLN